MVGFLSMLLRGSTNGSLSSFAFHRFLPYTFVISSLQFPHVFPFPQPRPYVSLQTYRCPLRPLRYGEKNKKKANKLDCDGATGPSWTHQSSSARAFYMTNPKQQQQQRALSKFLWWGLCTLFEGHLIDRVLMNMTPENYSKRRFTKRRRWEISLSL